MEIQEAEDKPSKINLGGLKQSSLIEALRSNNQTREIDFGKLSNSNLKAIAEIFSDKEQPHNIQFITISEGLFSVQIKYYQIDPNELWENNSKQMFLSSLRTNAQNFKIMSVDVICKDAEKHLGLSFSQTQFQQRFMTELSLICMNNRDKYCQKFLNHERSKILEQKEIDYFEENNYQSNAIKFSCKKYVNNVFKNILDDGLYLLQKERTNQMRDDQILNITKGQKVQKFVEDIFTADGSCVFLAKYLLDNLEASYKREKDFDK